MTRVKICGLTLPADAVACRELGVDFIGMIFATDLSSNLTK